MVLNLPDIEHGSKTDGYLMLDIIIFIIVQE